MKQLTSEVRRVESLSNAERAELFDLFAAHYDAVTADRFAADLAAKHGVLLLRDAAGVIKGFSTQVTRTFEVHGEAVRVLFSGDTIIAPECWGTQELVRAWCRYAGVAKSGDPTKPLYWLLLSKGHRTYMYLPLFFRTYHPSPVPCDPHLVQMKHAIATHMFGADYKPATGRLEFDASRGQLRESLAEPPATADSRPHVAFFLNQNPRYAEGHELVCLAEISPENMRGMARKHLIEGMTRKDAPASTWNASLHGQQPAAC